MANGLALDEEAESLLNASRIGMLALTTGTQPLVNPAAFHYAGGHVLITTSRTAFKVALAKRSPDACFLVQAGDRCLVLEGEVEVFDPRAIESQVRAASAGPDFLTGLAGYALKNAAYIGGYLVDIAKVPSEWYPYNRALLRMRVDAGWWLDGVADASAAVAALPGASRQLAGTLGRVAPAYLCTLIDGSPLMAPARWAVDGGAIYVTTPSSDFLELEQAGEVGLVIESHHDFRATQMVGAFYRGRAQVDGEAVGFVSQRYRRPAPATETIGLRITARKLTFWEGFGLETIDLKPGGKPPGKPGGKPPGNPAGKSAGKTARKSSAPEA